MISITNSNLSFKIINIFACIKKFKVFQKEYWGEDVALWSRSYFVASVGGATLDVLKEYIEQQSTPV